MFYGERTPWWLKIRATGPTGHASRFIKETAIQKLLHVANRAYEFRRQQEAKLGLEGGCSHSRAKMKMGDVTTVNMTVMQAGTSAGGRWAINGEEDFGCYSRKAGGSV